MRNIYFVKEFFEIANLGDYEIILEEVNLKQVSCLYYCKLQSKHEVSSTNCKENKQT